MYTPNAAVRSANPAPESIAPVPATSALECLTFTLGREQYGIDILRVQEIRGYEQPTRIASAPDFVKGVVNLRGVIVPIVDLRMKFNTPDIAYDGLTVTVIVTVAGRVFGVVVDSVSDVVLLGREDVRPAPEFGTAIDVNFITGLGTLQQGDVQRMLILLDIERLLSSADMGLVRPTAH